MTHVGGGIEVTMSDIAISDPGWFKVDSIMPHLSELHRDVVGGRE
jgi:hypothetical protein